MRGTGLIAITAFCATITVALAADTPPGAASEPSAGASSATMTGASSETAAGASSGATAGTSGTYTAGTSGTYTSGTSGTYTAPAEARASTEPTTIEWWGGEVNVLLGGNWGGGILHYGGYDYDFSLGGLKLAGLGAQRVTGSAKVYNLTRPEDLNGVYAGAGIGLVIAGGGQVAVVQNQNGVRLDIVSTGTGLNAWIGPKGMKLAIPESTIAAVNAMIAADKAAAQAEDAANRAEAAVARLEAASDKLAMAMAAHGLRRERATAGVGKTPRSWQK
jgi:hypothetical protein